MQGFSAQEILDNALADHPELTVHRETLADIIETCMMSSFTIAKRKVMSNAAGNVQQLFDSYGGLSKDDMKMMILTILMQASIEVFEEEIATPRGSC